MKNITKFIISIVVIILVIIVVIIGKNTNKKSEVYKSDNLGISIELPKEWSGEYKIQEDKDSIHVFYEPNIMERGLLFGIVKVNEKDNPVNGEIYDTIGPNRFIETKSGKYMVGSTTDVGFPDDSSNYKRYSELRKQASEVLKSLTILK